MATLSPSHQLVRGLVPVTGHTERKTAMNVMEPRIAYLEIDRRLRAAEHRRRARWARAATRSPSSPAFPGRGDK